MATTIATLAAKLSLDNRAFLAGFRQSITASKGFAASIGSGMAGAVASMGAAVAASLSLAAAVGKVGQSMTNIDRQAKLADRLGLTNEAMQRMAVIAKSGNVDVETLAKAMLTMGRNIGTGGKALDERFFDVADAIAAIKDPAERSKRAMEIFGKEGNELINMLAEGSGKMRENAKLLDRFGLSMSRMDAAKVEAANDAWTRMGIVIDGLTDKLAVGFAPTVENTLNRLLDHLDAVGDRLDMLGGKWANLANIVDMSIKAQEAVIFGTLRGSLLGNLLLGFGGPAKKPAFTGTDPATPFKLPESPGKRSREVSPAAMERNSVEAVRAVQKAGGDPITALHTEMQKAVRALIRIEEHVDPLRGNQPVLMAATI